MERGRDKLREWQKWQKRHESDFNVEKTVYKAINSVGIPAYRATDSVGIPAQGSDDNVKKPAKNFDDYYNGDYDGNYHEDY